MAGEISAIMSAYFWNIFLSFVVLLRVCKACKVVKTHYGKRPLGLEKNSHKLKYLVEPFKEVVHYSDLWRQSYFQKLAYSILPRQLHNSSRQVCITIINIDIKITQLMEYTLHEYGN